MDLHEFKGEYMNKHNLLNHSNVSLIIIKLLMRKERIFNKKLTKIDNIFILKNYKIGEKIGNKPRRAGHSLREDVSRFRRITHTYNKI